MPHPSATTDPLLSRRIQDQLTAYEGLMWGTCLDEHQARELRALARIYDVEAGPDLSLACIWARLRPLLTQNGFA